MSVRKNKDNLPKNLHLKLVDAYVVIGSHDDRSNYVVGYCREHFHAKELATGKGWYCDGSVEFEKMYIDDNGNLYEVESCGRFKDEKKTDSETAKDILNKLSAQEQQFLTKYWKT